MSVVTAKRRLDDLDSALARLAWKTMKALIELETPSANAGTARAAIKAAYGAGWIDDS